MRRSWNFPVFLGFLSLLIAQDKGVRKPVQDQSAASFSYDPKKDEPTVRIQNVAYEVIDAKLAGQLTNSWFFARPLVRNTSSATLVSRRPLPSKPGLSGRI